MVGQLELRVESVAFGGDGVGRVDGRACFVPGALPGERIAARVVQEKKSYLKAALLEVLEPSPRRVAPACPLAGRCPGCQYQHADYALELEMKQRQLGDLLSRLGGVDPAIRLDPVASPAAAGYRDKITLHAAAGRLGYIMADNATVLDVPACPLAAPELNARLAGLRQDQAFMASLADGEDLGLHVSGGAVETLRRRDKRDGWFTKRTSFGDFLVPPGSFFQVNQLARDLLYREAMELFRQNPAGLFVDLFCGVGVFAIAAALSGAGKVLGCDLDPQGVDAARRNAAARGLGNVSFAAVPAEGFLRRLPKAHDPDDMALLVDPPRSGLEKVVVADIAAARPRSVIYVSCAPDTLARDLRLFGGLGYAAVSSRLVDMFPRTASFESVTLLSRMG